MTTHASTPPTTPSTTPPTWELQISAGTGPVEVRRFVAALAPALAERCRERGLTVVETRCEGEAAAPRSISLGLHGEPATLARIATVLADQLGTHALIDDARRARRGHHRGHRKRWFAAVSLHRLHAVGPVAPLDLAEVELRCDRAGGPGGQHVNTTSSAVRALHRPTRLAVRVAEGRSQHHNKTLALARLAELVADRQRREVEAAARLRHGQHQSLHRGDAIASWRWGDKQRTTLTSPTGE